MITIILSSLFAQQSNTEPLRIIAFGAHPDDSELKAGGVAALRAAQGHTDTPPTKKNPVFMYYSDGFQRPYPFEPTIVIGIDEVAEKNGTASGLCPHNLRMQIPGQVGLYPMSHRIHNSDRSIFWEFTKKQLLKWLIDTGIDWCSCMVRTEAANLNMRKHSNFSNMAPKSLWMS
ncbi:hypothetical protein [Daejeonella sp.]|uniref:hypothetical protein n=1 Tax=Daejeonella sp. TaxID=2805397 RepID=UPI003983C1BE